jgi:hypothetical protein
MVDRADAVHGLVGSVHGFSFRKTIPGKSNFGYFAHRPLSFFEINPQSMNSKKVPSLRKIHKNSPKTSKFRIFSTTTPNLVTPSPKFSGSLLLSFYAFI